MIVAVSDVHLGTSQSDKNQFEKFLNDVVDKEQVSHFVLAGDIVDMWRRDLEEVLMENTKILQKLKDLQNEKREIHFLAGNHDYHATEMDFQELYGIDASTKVILRCGTQEYFFIHGYQFEFADNLEIYQKFADELCKRGEKEGRTADEIWELLKMGSSAVDKIWFSANFRRVKKSPGERLTDGDVEEINKTAEKERKENKDQIGDKFMVFGHTHRPFVDAQRRLANTGSWVDDPTRPYLERNTYLVIEEGKDPVLKKYPH